MTPGHQDRNAVAYWRTVIRQALSDCSTVDYHNLSIDAVDNLALVAAQAVQRELSDISAGESKGAHE
jgi:hypothetical protein